MLLPDLPCDEAGNPIWADWSCPVCGTYTPRVARPGRPAIYCSNACRQKAYRFRRRHGIRLLQGDGQPVHRARGARVTHALRPGRDPMSSLRASNRQAVSLCGAFVRPVGDTPNMKPEFHFDDANACFACLELTSAGRPDVAMIYPWQMSRTDYVGPPLEPRPARDGYELSIRGLPRRWRKRRRRTRAAP